MENFGSASNVIWLAGYIPLIPCKSLLLQLQLVKNISFLDLSSLPQKAKYQMTDIRCHKRNEINTTCEIRKYRSVYCNKFYEIIMRYEKE